jgi:hypothetical protein
MRSLIASFKSFRDIINGASFQGCSNKLTFKLERKQVLSKLKSSSKILPYLKLFSSLAYLLSSCWRICSVNINLFGITKFSHMLLPITCFLVCFVYEKIGIILRV